LRFIRFLILILSIVAVYAAQHIFDHRNLTEFFPAWLLDYFPALFQFTRWLPRDLINMGLVIMVLSSIGFGLITSQWIGEYSYYLLGREPGVLVEATIERRRLAGIWSTVGLILLTVSACMVAYVAGTIVAGNGESFARQLIWVLSICAFLFGSLLLDRGMMLRRPESRLRVTTKRRLRPVTPTKGWPIFLAILAVAGLLYSWGAEKIPALVDDSTAQIGLQALSIARGETSDIFAPGATGSPLFTYLPAAIAMRITGDPLLGIRLSGLLTGLLTVVATWLLGCELFRRTPRLGSYQILIEDDGRWIANVAAALLAFGYVMFHFSRTPVYLAPVAWGTLGLWALLRGLRTGDWFALALSGALIGWSSVLYAGGLLYLIITPIWWIGVWLLRREWLYNRGFGVGSQGFLLWLGSLLVTIAPVVAVWRANSTTFLEYTQKDVLLNSLTQSRLEMLFESGGLNSVFWENLRLTLLTFNLYPNAGTHFELENPFLNSIVAPIFVLSLGVLILNLDRLPGWLLLSTIGGGVILAAVNPNAPFWARLLPLLPIIALATAFALDRMRITLIEAVGTAFGQTAVYLTVGMVIWAGVNSWIVYYNYAQASGDAVSYTGRAVRNIDPEQTAVLLVNNPQTRIRWGDPVLTFLSSRTDDVLADPANLRKTIEISPSDWPETLPRNSALFIQPEDRGLLDTIKQRYPDGTESRVRDSHGNLMLFVYTLEGSPAAASR